MSKPVQSKARVMTLIKQNQTTLKSLGVKRLGLFGSFVHGKQRARSDVDFLVEFEPGAKSFDNFMRLSFFLQDLMGRRVEVITPESLSPYIGPHIIKEVEYAAIST